MAHGPTSRREFLAKAGGGLAALLAGTSLASGQTPSGVNAKPANKTELPDGKPLLLERAIEFSKVNPVVAIIITKGSKDPITGEKVYQAISNVLKKDYDGIPSEPFIEPGADYTVVGFAVGGHLYGPYSLKESLNSIVLAAASYDDIVRTKGRAQRGTGLTAKPENHPE